MGRKGKREAGREAWKRERRGGEGMGGEEKEGKRGQAGKRLCSLEIRETGKGGFYQSIT